MTARSTSRSRASCCCACGLASVVTVAAGIRHSVLCFSHDACTAVRVRKYRILSWSLYGYENKDFFHGHINTQIIFKFPDKLIGRRAPTTAVPPRTSDIQQQSCSSQEIQRIASLHLAETLRPTALPHDSAPPLDHVQVAAVRAAWHQS